MTFKDVLKCTQTTKISHKTNSKIQNVKQSRNISWRRRRRECTAPTSSLNGVNFQCHTPASLYPRQWTRGTHCTGGWVGHRAGLNSEVRGKFQLPLPGIEHVSPGRPIRSRILRYPGSSHPYTTV
jgi:hypothetical protein